MTSHRDMVGGATRPFLIFLLTISTVLTCTPMQPGQERVLNFNVTGFNLPVPMVYTEEVGVRAQLPSISQSAQAAQSFVSTLVMQSVTNVLEREGRNAGLFQFVIDLILQQLTVQINYTPMNCAVAYVNPTGQNAVMAMKPQNCIVIGNIVSVICDPATTGNMPMCSTTMNVLPIPDQHLTISGTLRVTNFIMAGWSQQMWQTILNRVAQDLRTGPYGANFYSARATIV